MYSVGEVERIMKVLDNKASQIEEVCIESEEQEKMEEIENSSEGSDKYLYKGSRIMQQPPPTVSNAKKMCKEWTSNLVELTKFLTEESKELNMPKTKLEDRLLQISSPYSMKYPLLWLQKMSADEKEHFKPIIILIQFELPKNESTAYQESTFLVAANNMSNFQTNMRSKLLERRTLMHQNCDFMHKCVFNN